MYGLRASALGSCVRAQAALLAGFTEVPAPKQMQAAYERGHLHEEECRAVMREQGWTVDREQEEVVYLGVVGHIDGTCYHGQNYVHLAGEYVWEAKAPDAWAKYEKAYKTRDWSDPLCHRYAWQSSVYMGALGMEQMVSCLKDGRVLSFVIEEPPFTAEHIALRVADILELAGGGRQRLLEAPCSQSDYPCPVVYLHAPQGPVEADPELDEAVLAWERAKTVSRQAKEAEDRAKDLVVRVLGDRDKVETGLSKVTRYSQTRSSVDAPRLSSEMGIDLTPWTKETKVEGVRITVKETGDDESQ